MRHGRAGAEELTDPENERVLATLTPETWRGISVELIASRFFKPVIVKRRSPVWHPDHPWEESEIDAASLAALQSAYELLEIVLREARQSSGSIGGAHRVDLKEALIGAPIQGGGLSVQVAEPRAPKQPERGL